MADKGNRAPLAPNDTQAAELKMRQALGLNTRGPLHKPQQRPEQARQRHRFVQDGGVPVTVLNPRQDVEAAGLRERIEELQSSLEHERAAHASARRALQEQQAATQALQTRLAHAELAHNEALSVERHARAAAQEALANASVQARRAPKAAEPEDGPEQPATANGAAKTKRGRPRTAPQKEPKPVRWWTPSFRAKTKA